MPHQLDGEQREVAIVRLTEEEWERIRPLLEAHDRRGAWVGNGPIRGLCWRQSSTATAAAVVGTRFRPSIPTTARSTERTNAGNVWAASSNSWTRSGSRHPKLIIQKERSDDV